MKKAVIVVPTYNEAENAPQLIEKIFNIAKEVKGWEIHLVFVDSHSTDNTGKIVEKLTNTYPRLHIIHTKKEGLGKAYLEGFETSLEKLKPDVLFEMDADFSHDPHMIPLFLKKIDEGADFVIGSRYRKGGSIPKDWALKRKLFSVIGNLIIRLGFMKLSITDWTSGYRAIRADMVRDTLDQISQYTGYVFQVAILDNAIKKHARIAEIPIQFTDRKYGESKINSGQYIQNILRYVLLHSTFIKYVIVGVSGFVIDFGVSYLLIEIVHEHFPVWIATIISAELAIIWNFFWNNYWSFSHKKVSHESSVFMKSLLKFNSVAVGSILIQSTLVELATRIFGRDAWMIAKVLILGFIIIPYSYILYNKVIWKNKKN